MKKQYLFAVIAILFWSSLATVTKLLLNGGISSFQVLMYGALFAVIVLFLFNLFKGKLKKLTEYTFKDYTIICSVGVLGTFFYYVFYYLGAAKLPASQAFIVNYMWPIMSVVFAIVVLRERMTLKKALAVAVSFIGVVIVVGKDLLSFKINTITGAIWCLLGAVCYGLFTALDKKFGYDKSLSMLLGFLVSFILSLIINIANRSFFVPNFAEILGLAWNGIFVLAIASTCWNIALSKGSTAKISNLAYITPFLSLVWTWLILDDEGIKNPNSLIGLCVIVAGIFIQFINLKKQNGKEKNQCHFRLIK